jgi:hypothetical protein
MSMPSLDQVVGETYLTLPQSERGDYETVLKTLDAALKAGIGQVVSTVVTVLTGVNYLTVALKPWLAANSVRKNATTTMDLYDLLPVNEGGKNAYLCLCGLCEDTVRFAIGKREANAIKHGLSAAVVPVPFIAAYSVGRNAWKLAHGTKGADRTAHAIQLQTSALPLVRKRKVKVEGGAKMELREETQILKPGCPKAQAAIAILLKELDMNFPSQSPLDYPKSIAAITSMNGWQPLKKAMYGGPL